MGCPSVNTMLDWVEGQQPPEGALVHLSDCSQCRDLADALRASGEGSSGAWLDALAPSSADDVETAKRELAAGDEIAGRYRLVQSIGEGATGLVWEASSLGTEQRVAMKFLKARNPAHVRRLVREARVVAALHHESIVEMIEVLESDGAPVIVMELLEGEPLANLLERRGRLDVAETVALAASVASALEAAHEKGVVHRDLKPENVFVLHGGHVKVLDFGMAKLMDRSAIATSTSLTRTGALVGTPCYMAPEQLFGDQDVDARADIWALGAILYECLAGKRPVQGEHLGQIFKRIALGDIPPLASLTREVPRALDALVVSMLARDRNERPESMRAVIFKLHTLEGKKRSGGRWLAAAACIAAVATLAGFASSSTNAARVESDLASIPRATATPLEAAPKSAPAQKARTITSPKVNAAPAVAKPSHEAAPASSEGDRLPGGVLKTSPY